MYLKNKHNKFLSAIIAGVIAARVVAIDPAGLETALQDWAGDQPGVIVALAIAGDERAFVSAGKWTATDSREADQYSFFEIGSITKVFTSLLVADAMGAGLIMWDSPIGGPFAQTGITYAQLATHTSGLPGLPADFSGAGLADPYAGIGRDALIKSFALESAALAAGLQGWAYSKFGSAVLGEAVVGAMGSTYPDLIRGRVLARLGIGLTRTSVLQGRDALLMVPGHNEQGETPTWSFDAYAPVGALVSSANQMERFMRAMLNLEAARLPRSWAETMQPRTEVPGGARGVWLVDQGRGGGHGVFWHSGGTGGFRSFIGVQPATGRAIIVMGGRDRAVEALGWLQGLLETKKEEAVTGEISDYVGDHPLLPSLILRVTEDGGQLYVQGTRQPQIGLRAAGADKFTQEGVTAALTFERDASGEVAGLVLQQNGAARPAKRFSLGSQSPEKKSLRMAPGYLEALVGQLRFDGRI